MPARRRATDDEILAATARVSMRLGPHRMRLEDVGAEVGVSGSAIAQRFGSKRDLLLALARRAPEALRATFDHVRPQTESPLEALVESLARDASDFGSAEQVSASLAILQLDLTDPDFRKATTAYFDAFRERVVALLDEAVERRELRKTDTAALARLVEITYNGSLLTWALRQGEDAASAMRRDLEALLEPHMTGKLTRTIPALSRGGSPGGAAPAGRRGRARGP